MIAYRGYSISEGTGDPPMHTVRRVGENVDASLLGLYPSVEAARAAIDAQPLTADTITEEEIRELRDEQESSCPVGPYWSTCVDALSAEWHEDDGAAAVSHNRERAAARARCAEILNARRSA